MGRSPIDVRPVTWEIWKDFVRLFEKKGSPHDCFCTSYRVRPAEIERLVHARQPRAERVHGAPRARAWAIHYSLAEVPSRESA